METSGPEVLVFAPGARNGELIVARLRATGVDAVECIDLDDLETRLRQHAAELGTLVLTHAALRDGAGRVIEHFQEYEPPWSALPIVLLAPALDAWLPPWRNTLVLTQPTTAALLAAAVRRALEARSQQHAVARANAHLTRLAYRDGVTGLPNRSALFDRIRELQDDRRGSESAFAAMFLDLDAFKTINDRYGHLAGDEALRQVAGYLLASVRSHDFVARWGGDEFIVLLIGADSTSRVADTGRRLGAGALVRLSGVESPVRVSLSYGVLHDVGADTDPDEVLKIADARMYEHKARKKGAKVEEA